MSFWRDLVIVVWGLVGTIALVFISIIVYLFYKRTMSLLESADLVVSKVGEIVDYADKEVIKPVMQFGTIVQGIVQGMDFISNIFKKKEAEDE
ncbi:MAG: hypothetical protein NT082_02670 [Chloroflexi bacterium]|nr:hypothetical protein [Chloroflexota bacterium]